MDNIIIIRAADQDGSIFQRMKDALEGYAKEVIDISALPNKILTFLGLTIQVETGSVLRDGRPVRLHYGELSMLCHLARHPGFILSRDQLYYVAYGEDHFSSNTVPSTICQIRRKIEPKPHHPSTSKQIIGLGYRFESPK